MRKDLTLVTILLAVLTAGCRPDPVDYTTLPEEKLRHMADSLAQVFILTDGHVDLPYRLNVRHFRLEREFLGIPLQSNTGDFDYERARQGGLDAPFMSIYIPASYQQLPDHGKAYADSVISMVTGITDSLSDKFAFAGTPAEVEANTRAGKISLPMGMENGCPIGNDLKNLEHFYKRGIRYITLSHSKDNQICDSSGDTTHTWNGLSPFGRDVVKEMNRLGIMVDISHVDDSTFYQVLALTEVPCIASHSACRFFAPTVRRDMTDDMIRKMGEHGGVIHINFYNAFLDSAVVKRNQENREKLATLLEARNLKYTDSLAKPVIEQFRQDNPSLNTDVEMVANHIDHIVKLAGIDHVGLGSDFDGVDGDLPTGLEDVSKYPNLLYVLLKRGYSPEDIEKICSKNTFRVWNAALAAARP
ncbi:dipeptidase [Parachryseolinea silvisoli]|uniref:dipeptidase n=1 Tax=Parachryseolinea silvisoli TaxID=2873601 RepID=UPI0022659FD9|nr:dipeptidase [Parachryseolinea silvisoli]MCD9016055.1 dipeptidase [Parachryseolinea silvisoli]